jgi:hypothetical protein
MGTVVPLPRRELFVDSRGSALRVSWHDDRGCTVLSIWRDDVCVATARLDAGDATRLAQFLVGHLGAIAAEAAPDQTQSTS